MNKITSVLLGFAFLFLTAPSFASQWTVSNDPNRVAQYTAIQEAIDAAANGDTILVYGSPTSYGNINIYKPIVLIGEGYNANVGLTARVGVLTFQRFNSTLSADGSRLMGFQVDSRVAFNADFTGSTADQRTLDNITILRCSVPSFYLGNVTSASEKITNVDVLNCLVTSSVDFYTFNTVDSLDVTFSNSIFDGIRISADLNRTSGVLTTYTDLSNVKFYNSLFLSTENGLLSGTVGLVFEDNIFFGHELFGGDYAQVTWNNNLFYLVDETASLFTNDNVGSGNLLNNNPTFTSYPATPTAFDYSHDYSLQTGSPALTASLSGGEIGIFGGAYPFTVGAKPPVPSVIEITIQDGTSSVPVGGTINFNFKAQSGN